MLLAVGGTLPSPLFFSFRQGSESGCGESMYEEKVIKSEKEWHFAAPPAYSAQNKNSCLCNAVGYDLYIVCKYTYCSVPQY